MEKYTRIMREYPAVSFRYTKGNIDIFHNKQFHSYFEIYFLLNGKVEFITDHQRRELPPYSLVIIPPGQYHLFPVAQEEIPHYERCVLNIHPEFLQNDIFENALRSKRLLSLTPNHRIAQHFQYLRDSMERTDETDFGFILSAIATDIIFLLKQDTPTLQTEVQGFSHSLSPEIMNYVNQNIKLPLTVHDIAQHFFLSDSSVAHIFKSDFGISIKKYLTEKRLNEIHMRLQRGEKPQALSEEFGFANYSTFYRSYCKHFDAPPSKSK